MNTENKILLKELTIKSKIDGLPLSVIYSEAANPKGILQCCHGMVEHKERYTSFMQFLSQHGYHCIIHDMRGHGKSLLNPEDLGYFYKNGSSACIEDLRTINEYLHKQYPELPIFLYGHSMGSMEVRSYCKRYDSTISGLIISGSPSYNKAARLGGFLIKIMTLLKGERYRSRAINSIALGSYNRAFSNEGDSPHNWISAEKNNVREFDNDSLCGFIFTLNGFNVLTDLMIDTYKIRDWKLSNPSLPVLFISGGDDPCRVSDKDFYAAVESMKKVGYNNVSAILYPGNRHELLNEKNADVVMDDILAFLDKSLSIV